MNGRHAAWAAGLLALGLIGCTASSGADVVVPTDATDDAAHADAPRVDDTLVAMDSAPRDAGPDAAPDAAAACGQGVGDRNLAVSEPYPASTLVQNGGRVIDVRNPPSGIRAAVGDGVADDTEALRDVFDYLKAALQPDSGMAPNTAQIAGAMNFIVYVPDGTYRVTDTLIYRGASIQCPHGAAGCSFGSMTGPAAAWEELVRVRIVGQSREGVVIRLDDHATGFGDATMPKPVLTYQHPDSVFNNWAADNELANVTIDVGHGNAGAVGAVFMGANSAMLRNVLIRSGDGAGAYGLWIRTGSSQAYLHDLTIDGFDSGVFQSVNPEIDNAFEHVTLRHQRVAGMRFTGGGASLRDVLSDQSAGDAEAVRIEQTGAQVVLVDSALRGTATAAIELTRADRQSLFARGVCTTGYGAAVRVAGAVAAPAGDIDEYVSLPVATLATGQPTRSIRLPVQATPLVPWFDPATQWANVDDYGAAHNGTTDDTAAVQRALASGRPVVYLPHARYALSGTLHVPATVRRIDVMYADIGDGVGFSVDAASSDPVLIARKNGYSGVTLRAMRDVVLALSSGGFSNPGALPTRLFIEASTNVGAGDQFTPHGQQTWARSLNDEQGSGTGDVVANGGTLWVLGYKTENKPVSSVRASNGALVEVLGGYANRTEPPMDTPVVLNDHANVSYVGFTNRVDTGTNVFTNIVRELRGTSTATLTLDHLPVRGSSDVGDVFVPLYVGYDPAALPH